MWRKVLIEYLASSEAVSKKHPDKVADWISDAYLAGGGMNGDELREHYPLSETDPFKQIVARSNCSFEIDFRKFLRSKYLRNRVILVDTCASHMQVPRTIIPPITQIIKSAHEILIPHAIKEPSQLLECESNGYIIVTIRSEVRSEANQLQYIKSIRKEICDGRGCFKTFKAQNIPFHPEPLTKGQIYLAVVHFTSKYITGYNKYPYSHMDIYSIYDKKKASKLVARFEDGDELTVSDIS